jgi:SpoVK/Ycf46/Vps4 family AAA+-type ATPase
LAAHEAKKGHTSLAHEIRDIIDKSQQNKIKSTISFLPELGGLVITRTSVAKKASLVINTKLKDRIIRIITEYRQQSKLKSFGLKHRRKILLAGPPGTGKTMTANILAGELNIPIHTIQVDRLLTKFMGESSAKLRQIFELIEKSPGVYLFDEFDAIGGERTLENDVGEMRRVLNSFLQFIEQDTSDSLIIAATNNPHMLDHALFRRFDDVLFYERPDKEECKQLIQNILGTFITNRFAWKKVLQESEGLSHSELSNACQDAIKQAILFDKKEVNASLLLQMLQERQGTLTAKKVI